MNILTILEERWGLVSIYRRTLDQIFNWTLRKDLEKQRSYKGYPTKFLKALDEKGKQWGIPFVNHEKSDYTFYPIMRHYRDKLGGTESVLFKKLEYFNMRIHGGFFNRDRLKAQLDTLESYMEYFRLLSHMEILEILIDREIPKYMKKILKQHMDASGVDGGSMVDFIKQNGEYFSEITTIFDVEERPTGQLLEVAIEELTKLTESSSRGFIMKYSLINGVVNIIIAIIAFSKLVLPEAMSSFDGNINMMSKPIQIMDKIGYFLINQWYLAVLGVVILFLISRTRVYRMAVGYMAFKFPITKEYVVNDQLLRFFQTYSIVSETEAIRKSFEYGYNRIDNEYLKFVFGRYLDGGQLDLSERAVNLSVVLEEIPYIPKEYVDIIRDTEQTGNHQDGIPRVIVMIEPRLAKVNDQLQKTIIIGSIVVSMGITVILSAFLMKDITSMVSLSEEQFYDSIR